MRLQNNLELYSTTCTARYKSSFTEVERLKLWYETVYGISCENADLVHERRHGSYELPPYLPADSDRYQTELVMGADC